MRKRWLVLPAFLFLLLFTGCSTIDGALEEQIRRRSDIQSDPGYQQYRSYEDQGHLTEDGYFSEELSGDASAESSPPLDVVHITFARNSFLDVHYYSDAEHTVELPSTGCRLPAGSSVFASAAPSGKAPSSKYIFSGFEIYQYDGSGKRSPVDGASPIVPDESGLILTVAGEFIGKELSVEPIGAYQTREIFLRARCMEDNGGETDVSGSWAVNNRPVSGGQAEINPISSYIISYEFDPEEYFFESSEPECYYSNNEDGIVIFSRRESTDETVDYRVNLHRYMTIPIVSGQERTVCVDGGTEQKLSANDELSIPHLKYGQEVTILTDTEWAGLDSRRELILQSTEKIAGTGSLHYKYTLIVPQKEGEFRFDPSEYTYEHGTITFKCFGEEAVTTQYLAKGSKISYEQKTADDGYWLSGANHVITVTTPEETRRQLESIHFTPKVPVLLQLEQPEYGGSIQYYIDGRAISSSEYRAYSGEKLTMSFQPWEGWINNYVNGVEYKITEGANQTPTINGKNIDTAFIEDPDHKPALSIVLSKSVGETMDFSFTASGLENKSCRYTGGFLNGSRTVIDKQPIGTEKGIGISMGNRAIQAGTAIKILIEKTGTDKRVNSGKEVTVTDCRLIDDLTEAQGPIDIYDPAEMGSSSMWYRSVKITISAVDVLQFPPLEVPENMTVIVRNQKTSQALQAGDIMEGLEKVTVTISPGYGYYLSGNGVKNNLYQRTMDFKKCLSEIEKIVQEHPVQKYCEVALAADDPYGSRAYTLDGKPVSGKISAKEGQKLTLKYTVTHPGYAIEGAAGLFGSPIGKNTKEKTASITIDRSYDGKTVGLADFGIGVTKGE